MLLNLLEDRFQVKYHREEREESGYALVVTKNGSGLEKFKDDEVIASDVDPSHISARRWSMAMFASLLSTVGRSVRRSDLAKTKARTALMPESATKHHIHQPKAADCNPCHSVHQAHGAVCNPVA